jgi:hypothetical protein
MPDVNCRPGDHYEDRRGIFCRDVIRERGRSRHLVDRTAVSLSQAEAAAELFAAQKQISW